MSFATTIDAAATPVAPGRTARWMLWTVAGMTGLLLLWAALARVDEVASAGGRVIPSRQLQTVSNLEGGSVKAILVRPGERVVAGQVLLRLDSTAFAADAGRTGAAVAAMTARAARLQAEVSGRAADYPAGLSPDIIATERVLAAARAGDLGAARAMAMARLDQARAGLDQSRVDAAARTEGATLAAREAAMIAPLVEKGIEPQIELIRSQSALALARGAAANAALAVGRARAAVAEAESGLRSVGQRARAEAVETLTSTRADLAGQDQALPALQDRVRRTEVRAQVAGTINRVLVATVGGSVRPGEPLVEIVPLDDALVVEADIKPADIAFVRIGQHATVKLTAYDYSVYGALPGIVERISPDATINERTGESHFTIRVRTSRAALKAQDGSPLPLGAGMIAQVDLLGHKRSVLSYLLTPVSKLRDNAFREK